MPTITKTLPRTPADFCDFCRRPCAFCHCDAHGFTLTDTGRAGLFAPNDYAPAIRRAYNQAAGNGNSIACTILRGIMPDVNNGEETCPECFMPIDAEPDAFSECEECERRLHEWNAANPAPEVSAAELSPEGSLAYRLAESMKDDSPAFD